MKVVLISGGEDAVPAEYLRQIRDAGIELACKKCEGEAAVLEFSKDADLVWMFGPNRGLIGAVLLFGKPAVNYPRATRPAQFEIK